MKQSKFHGGTLVQGVILFGFSVYLIKLLGSGEIYRLVAPYIANLLWITLLCLLVMTFYTLGRIYRPAEDAHPHHGQGHSHSLKPNLGWAVLTVPVVIGLVVPTQSLGASMVNTALKSKQSLSTAPIGATAMNTSTGQEQNSSQQQASSNSSTIKTPSLNSSSTPATKDGANSSTNSGTASGTNPSTSGTSSTASNTSGKNASGRATANSGKSSVNSVGVSTPASGVKPEDLVDLATVVHAEGDFEKPSRRQAGTDLPLDELMSNILIAPEYYFNQTYQYTGFVYHPPGWPQNRFVLVRYMISCCTADASPLGVTVEAKNANTFNNNQWVEVVGPLSTRQIADANEIVPIAWYQGSDKKPTVVATSVQRIDEPKHPYLNPYAK